MRAENPGHAEEAASPTKRARCQDGSPAAENAATDRVTLLDEANLELLRELCDGGDFLTAARRASIVREVLAGTASDPACRQLFREAKREAPSSGVFELVEKSPCVFAEPADCHGLGKVILAVANLQFILNAEWYEAAAESVWKALDALGELPEAAKAPSAKAEDEKAARLAEIIDVTASTVGIRAWYRSMGKDFPSLPPVGSRPPRFTCVTEFCPSGFAWNPNRGWGPQVPDTAETQDVLASYGVARPKWSSLAQPNPQWKWEPAPGTATQWFYWMAKMYPPLESFYDFAGSKWNHGVTATRLDMEIVAAAYTMKLGCSF